VLTIVVFCCYSIEHDNFVVLSINNQSILNMQKIILLTFITLIVILQINAQSNLKTEALFSNYDEAIKYAKLHKQPVLIIFSGYDWCKPCMIFKKFILSSKKFKTYYPEKFPILLLSFPIEEKNKLPESEMTYNQSFADKYNKTGVFPYMVMINIEGTPLGDLTYNEETTGDFIRQCNKLLKSVKGLY
jgi:thioredoxin-related protein